MQTTNNSNEWVEEAVSKKHIEYYEYKDFRNIEKIGNGNFGKVYRANWKNSEQYFALKSLSNLDNNTIKDVVKELEIHRKVQFGYNIISFFGITCKENPKGQFKKYLLAMEYADSGTLRTYLKNNKNITWENKYKFAYQLACAISCIHDEGIIHCDLHSGNILIHQDNIKLSDFGLSKKIEVISKTYSTQPTLFGIIPYIDPKKLGNPKYSLNKKSDVYSVGVLLWEISSGHPPFEDKSYDISLFLQVLQGYRETIIPDTSPDYSNIYTKCWDGEPDNRPDMIQVVTKLRALITNSILPIEELPPPECIAADTLDQKVLITNSILPIEELPPSDHIAQIQSFGGARAWQWIWEDFDTLDQKVLIHEDGIIEFLDNMDTSIQTTYPCFVPVFEGDEGVIVEGEQIRYSETMFVQPQQIPHRKLHYYEMTILKNMDPYNTNIAIGLATKPCPYNRLPGLNLYSVGYHSINGQKFNNDNIGIEFGPDWTECEDTVGCGYYSDSGVVFFTKNGKFLGNAFTDIKHIWFPTIGASSPCIVEINFGDNPDNEFKYKEAIGYGPGGAILLSKRRRLKRY